MILVKHISLLLLICLSQIAFAGRVLYIPPTKIATYHYFILDNYGNPLKPCPSQPCRAEGTDIGIALYFDLHLTNLSNLEQTGYVEVMVGTPSDLGVAYYNTSGKMTALYELCASGGGSQPAKTNSATGEPSAVSFKVGAEKTTIIRYVATFTGDYSYNVSVGKWAIALVSATVGFKLGVNEDRGAIVGSLRRAIYGSINPTCSGQNIGTRTFGYIPSSQVDEALYLNAGRPF